MATRPVEVYFETFDYTQPIKLHLLEGERIVSVDGSATRRVWIEGTAETAEQRYAQRANAQP